jgi:hypothetical protein
MQPLALLVLTGLLVTAAPSETGKSPPRKPSAQAAVPASQQGAAAPTAAQVPRDTRPAASTGSGIIRGRIVSADTGEPLRHARVELAAPEMRNTRAVPSDLEGRFEFQHLPAGRFTVWASKNGYVTLSYGQHRSFQAGRRIELAAGQAFDQATIALPRGAVIAGRVVNDLGEPVSGIRIGAYRLRYRDGRRDVAPAGRNGETDDLGQYRVSALPPGTYFVGSFGAMAAAGAVIEEGVTLAPTYYPATTNIAEGKPVTVRQAQEVGSIDITMVAGRAASVTGTVLDSRGRPAAALMVTVRPGGDSLLALLNRTLGTSQPNGLFAVPNLMPGEYMLHALVRTPDSKDAESADAPLTMGGSDIEGMTITAVPNGRITGRIIFDGDAKPPFPPGNLRVSAVAPFGLGDSSALVGAGWEFAIGNIEPGKMSLSVDALPAGWAVKRVVANGRDVTESSIDFAPGSSPMTVEITLTDKPTTLSGVVSRDAKTGTSEDYTVVVFGDDPTQWREGSKRILVARPDQNGTYKVTGLPPGRYRAIAVEYLDDGEQWNPELLGWARSRAARVELEEGAAVTLNLKLTRYAN